MPTTHTAVTQKLDRFLGLCKPCVRPMAVEVPGMVGDKLRRICPQCKGAVILERLYGTQTTMTCDPRCEGAVGSDCECACGGANHGGAFLETGEALASAVAKYRESAKKRSEAAKKAAESRRKREMERRADLLFEEETWLSAYEGDNKFLSGLKEQVQLFLEGQRDRHLSDNQLACVRRDMDKAAKDRVWHRAAAQRAGERQECPSGQGIEIEGTIVKLQEKNLPNGPVLQGRILTVGGWACWGTIPFALRQAGVQEGARVRFTAAMQRKENYFGFWSFPEGGEILEPVA